MDRTDNAGSSLTNNGSNAFKVTTIEIPRLHYVFKAPPESFQHSIAHRVEAWVINDNSLKILFVTKLTSCEQVEGSDNPKTDILIEAVGTFEFEKKLPKIKKVNDIPLVANLLALIYPFIREKINDCFNANNALFLLSPINTFKLIEGLAEREGLFIIKDTRE